MEFESKEVTGKQLETFHPLIAPFQEGPIQSLPTELLHTIFRRLPDDILQTVPLVCKFWSLLSLDNDLLKGVISNYFPFIRVPEKAQNEDVRHWIKDELKIEENFPEGAKDQFVSLSGLKRLNAIKKWKIEQEISEICKTFESLPSFQDFLLEMVGCDRMGLLTALREWEKLYNLEILYKKIQGNDDWQKEENYSSKTVSEKRHHIRKNIDQIAEGWSLSHPELELKGHLTQIPQEIGKFSNLETLVLSKNQLKTLPDEIKDLHNLKLLVLKNHNLERLPSVIFELNQLKGLKVCSSGLISLSPQIGQLHQLKVLKLNKNQLSKLPEDICELKQLKGLEVNENLLCELPLNFNKLSNLRQLEIENNQLKEIPSQIGGLIELESFSFQENPITFISPEIQKLHKLKTMWLDPSHLFHLPEEIAKCEELASLSIGDIHLDPQIYPSKDKLIREYQWREKQPDPLIRAVGLLK